MGGPSRKAIRFLGTCAVLWSCLAPAADTYMAQALLPLLTNAPSKKLVVIGDGTHVVLTEKNRMMLFREIDLFFAEGRR